MKSRKQCARQFARTFREGTVCGIDLAFPTAVDHQVDKSNGNVAMILSLWRRLRRKFSSIGPTILGAMILVGVMWLALYFTEPFLPEESQDLLEQLQYGDLRNGKERLRQLIASSGVAAELAFIGLVILQIIVAPIPGQLVGLLGGYLFGFWYGLLISAIGQLIGVSLAIALGRLFGRLIVRKFVSPRLVSKFDLLVGTNGLWNLFLLVLVPIFPDDALCFLAGLTKIDFWKLVLVYFAGRLPGLAALTFVGASAGSGQIVIYVVLGAATAIAIICWLFSDEVEAWFQSMMKQKMRA